MTRRERIELLLEHYDDFFDPGATGREGASDGFGTPLLPAMSRHPAVRELIRCLDRHREVAPVQHAHLMTFYRAEKRTVRGKPKTRMVRGQKLTVEPAVKSWTLERVVPPWVNVCLACKRGQSKSEKCCKVRRGVVFVVETWSKDVDPSLPRELLEPAA